MKLKHNKKRNTAFLFEALVKEITKSIISNNLLLKEELVNVVKIHFGKGKVLRQELDLIKNISDCGFLVLEFLLILLFLLAIIIIL